MLLNLSTHEDRAADFEHDVPLRRLHHVHVLALCRDQRLNRLYIKLGDALLEELGKRLVLYICTMKLASTSSIVAMPMRAAGTPKARE